MTLTQTYESTRGLLTGMAYHRGTTLVAQREYTYDVLRRPTARTTSRQGNVVNDTFVHNTRSELASAQVNGETYGYDYDNVGNRRMSMEAGDYAFYEANALNQYTDITGSENEADFSFTPEFDADGNQTSIKTETGIWTTIYNAENRPICFTNEATGTVVTCAYDSMGRRSFKKVTVNGTVTLHHRYLYRGYLQIACIDLTRSHHPGLWLITWDPTHPIATRPLAIQKDGTWYTYGLDLTKNVCEVFGTTGYIATTYTYSPYGSVTAIGTVTQPIRWSSEFYDNELDMVYYNYRYYNTQNGRWVGRDMIEHTNLYTYVMSNPTYSYDIKGMDFSYARHEKDLSFVWTRRKRIAYTGSDVSKRNIEKKHKEYQKYKAEKDVVKAKSSALSWFMSLFGLSYKKEERISNGVYYGPEFNMKIVTYYPQNLKVTTKGFMDLNRHENNRMMVYLYAYLYFIEPIKYVKCKVRCGVNYHNYTLDMLFHMINQAYNYAVKHLGSSINNTGINAENSHAVFIKDKEQMNLSDFQKTLNANPEKVPEYEFDGFNVDQLHEPTPPAQYYKPLTCP